MNGRSESVLNKVKVKVKISTIYDPYTGEESAGEDTCPGPSAL